MYKNWMNDVQDGSESCTSLEEYKKIAIFESGHRYLWGIERSGFFNGREKWVKGFESQMV